MNAGTLRHRVDIVSSARATPDGLGGGTRTSTVLASVWAAVMPANRPERSVAEALRGQITHVVTIRYPDSFTVLPEMRVLWQGRTFVIKGVSQPALITQWISLHCVEGE